MADPVVEGSWIRPPAEEKVAKPVWGLAEGLRIGLAPLPGPRGLLRVYTPYVGQPDWRMINFIAIEPIIQGQTRRGYSELEGSSLVEGTGKVMWSVDRPDDWTPRDPTHPARGVIGKEDEIETLTVFIGIEKFRSGAAVFLRLTFREDRHDEVEIATFTQPTSAPLSYCVVTATMGNYARLRRLHLATGVVTAGEMYSDATFGDIGFAPHKRFALERLARTRDGAAILAATSDEPDPAGAVQTTVARGWRYVGRPATQYWRCDHPPPKLIALVNARRTYWASNNPIPGGVSFENVELIAPFQPGQSWTFGVTTDLSTAVVHGESTPDAAKD
ncbi:MAG: hypothetical protein JJ992_00805 [Planctomycetes bacterium]|nr:hypothetical protein [Planctomycetota bacterium]